MKINALGILVLVSSLFIAAASCPAFEGPLAVKNQFPLFMNIGAPRLESAAAGTALTAGLSYSSVFMVRSSSAWSVNLDTELAELLLRYRRQFGRVEAGIELPVLSFSSGFLDRPLNSYHRAFGFSDYGRSSRPDNQFLYEIRRNGALIVKGKDGSPGIGDLRLSARYVVLEDDPAVSVRAEVELPTGDAKKGFGSGSVDAGVALLADKRISNIFKAYLNLGAVFPGNLKGYETVELDNFIYAGAALEAALWKKFSLLVQGVAQGSPFPKTGIGAMDRTSVLLTFGGRYSCGKDSLEFSVTEDPNTAGAPDVTFGLFYTKRF